MRVFDIGGPDRPYAASDRVVTIPNVLSLGRIALLPLVYVDIVSGRLPRAFLLLLLIAASDWFDGFLARVLDQRTRLGAVLDPIGDRLGFAVISIALVVGGFLPVWLVIALLGREVLVLFSGLVLLRLGRSIPETSRLGKAATAGLSASIVLLVAAHAFGGPASDPIAWLETLALAGLVLNMTLTYAATAGYARAMLAGRS